VIDADAPPVESNGRLPRPGRSLLPSSGFLRFVGRRAAALVLLAIGITFVVFLLTQAVPADPVSASLGEQAAGDPAAVAAFKAHYGLDKPLPERYAIYLGHLVQGDDRDTAQHAASLRRTGRILKVYGISATVRGPYGGACWIQQPGAHRLGTRRTRV